MRHNLGYLVTVSAIALCPAAVHASSGAADTFPNLVLALAMILVTAKLGGDIAIRLRQPAVLGELLAGVALGNASFFGITSLGWIRENPGLELLARLGAVLLLFEVGLESTVRDMLKVGWSALLVAIIGIAAPFGLGWLVAFWMLPERGPYVHAFIGAMLTATSVGITARVLKDLDQSQSGEARIILGAAVVDDVLGLVILAVITALIRGVDAGSPMTVGMVAPILLKASAFLVGGLALGIALTPVLFGGAARLHGSGVLLAAALAFCFFLSWAAAATGLAPIVGAYTAGLILEPIHVRKFTQRGEQGLEDLIRPLGSFLIPIFFVQMGLLVDLTNFARMDSIYLGILLAVAATAGKQLCALGVLESGVNRFTVGMGMVPRGEVGLIFAHLGLSLKFHGASVIDGSTYSAVVFMVLVTTFLTPPALAWSFRRKPST